MHCSFFGTVLLSCLVVFVSANCRSKVASICSFEQPDIFTFPKTKVELENKCLTTQNLLQCISDEWTKCAEESGSAADQERASKMSSAYKLLNDACGANPDFQKKVNSNIVCIADVFENGQDKCVGVVKEEMEVTSKLLPESGDEAMQMNCLRTMLGLNCMGRQVHDRCGRDAKEVVATAFDQIGKSLLPEQCFKELTLSSPLRKKKRSSEGGRKKRWYIPPPIAFQDPEFLDQNGMAYRK